MFRQATIVATQPLVPPQCSQVEFWEFRGRDRVWLFSPLFSSFDCPFLCDWLTDNKHCRRCRQEGIYRLCQMPARCRVARAGKNLSQEWMKTCSGSYNWFIITVHTSCSHYADILASWLAKTKKGRADIEKTVIKSKSNLLKCCC